MPKKIEFTIMYQALDGGLIFQSCSLAVRTQNPWPRKALVQEAITAHAPEVQVTGSLVRTRLHGREVDPKTIPDFGFFNPARRLKMVPASEIARSATRFDASHLAGDRDEVETIVLDRQAAIALQMDYIRNQCRARGVRSVTPVDLDQWETPEELHAILPPELIEKMQEAERAVPEGA